MSFPRSKVKYGCASVLLARMGCSHSMELSVITLVWPASAVCANTHACWKGSYNFMSDQQKAIIPYMREYTSAAENSKHHSSVSVVCNAYSLIRYNGCGMFFTLLESMGRACYSLPPVNRCYLTAPMSILRSYD